MLKEMPRARRHTLARDDPGGISFPAQVLYLVHKVSRREIAINLLDRRWLFLRDYTGMHFPHRTLAPKRG